MATPREVFCVTRHTGRQTPPHSFVLRQGPLRWARCASTRARRRPRRSRNGARSAFARSDRRARIGHLETLAALAEALRVERVRLLFAAIVVAVVIVAALAVVARSPPSGAHRRRATRRRQRRPPAPARRARRRRQRRAVHPRRKWVPEPRAARERRARDDADAVDDERHVIRHLWGKMEGKQGEGTHAGGYERSKRARKPRSVERSNVPSRETKRRSTAKATGAAARDARGSTS